MAAPNFADRDGLIWFDGELVPWRDARVHVLTHTLHYGLGCFEGVRAYATPEGTAIFRLKAHTKRLFNSAHILQMTMPWTQAEINEAQRLVVRENGLEEAYLRPMCFLGSEGMGLRAEGLTTHCIIAAWNWPSYMDPEAKERGIRVKTSSYTR
ncbi:MAG: branched chain amino acid aminotransferase, partial [Synechococcaceae bacterium WB7_3xG_012]|nr:branched chain amino acid aminotransferase [Synechococcaceae bacterium WB7_3xG_012]